MRWLRRLLIVLGILLGGVAFLGTVYASVKSLENEWLIRPIPAENVGSDIGNIQHTLGDFELVWQNNTLTIYYPLQVPRQVVWQSVWWQGFLSAGRGAETVTESRGLFQVTDDRQLVCTLQMVDSITSAEQQVTLKGTLTCADDSIVPYEIVFTLATPKRLTFTVSVLSDTLNRVYLTYASDAQERFLGFGLQYSSLDMKGRYLPIFVSEQGIGRGEQPLTAGANLTAGAGGDWYTSYGSIPYYITNQERGLYLDTYAYSFFDMRQYDRVQIGVFSNTFSGSILAGASPSDLITEYTAAIGRMRPLPDWIHEGAIVGVQGGTARVREVYQKLKAANVPIAALWLQDWVGQRTTSFGKQLWWNWELDREHYPDWEAFRAELAADGVRILLYVNPFLTDVSSKPNVQRNLYQEASEQGYLVKNQAGAPYLIRNTDFSAALVDFTNPAAWAWYQQTLTDTLLHTGASGWMADFGEALPYDAVLANGQSGAVVHNQYPELWAQFNREFIETDPNSAELVFFLRSAYTHSPQSGTLFWLGDQTVSWDANDGIKTAVIGTLSSGISGFSFMHSDIGGYTTISNPLRNYHRSQELLLRWMELNAFSVVFRSHEGNRPQDNVQVYDNETTLQHFARTANIYLAWGDYRRQLIEEAAQTGLPVIRPMFVQYPEEDEIYNFTYQQFMVGSEFLVAPVLDPETTQVNVYLPAGEWVHVWSNVTYGDPNFPEHMTISAPLGEPAVFYRKDSPAGLKFVEELKKRGVLN